MERSGAVRAANCRLRVIARVRGFHEIQNGAQELVAMNDLPHMLSRNDHAVRFQARRGEDVRELKEESDWRYVHITFAETRGGTELGLPLDVEKSDLTGADWQRGAGARSTAKGISSWTGFRSAVSRIWTWRAPREGVTCSFADAVPASRMSLSVDASVGAGV